MATAAHIREHYEEMAWVYRAFWGDHIHHGLFRRGDESPQEAQVKLIDFCFDLVAQHEVRSMLDVGCGHGGTLIHIARFQEGWLQGLGLTLSPAQARIAREKAQKAGVHHAVNFLVADAETFEYPPAAFEIVWNMESSEHFADKPRYFRYIFSTLVAGGRLLLAAWTGSMKSERVRAVARDFLCPSLQTPGEYRTQMEAAGLRVFAQHDLTASVARTWEILRRRARFALPLSPLLPRAAREFGSAIDVILDAYRSGDLTYTVLAAQKDVR